MRIFKYLAMSVKFLGMDWKLSKFNSDDDTGFYSNFTLGWVCSEVEYHK
jgi:hypothetical protein